METLLLYFLLLQRQEEEYRAPAIEMTLLILSLHFFSFSFFIAEYNIFLSERFIALHLRYLQHDILSFIVIYTFTEFSSLWDFIYRGWLFITLFITTLSLREYELYFPPYESHWIAFLYMSFPAFFSCRFERDDDEMSFLLFSVTFHYLNEYLYFHCHLCHLFSVFRLLLAFSSSRYVIFTCFHHHLFCMPLFTEVAFQSIMNSERAVFWIYFLLGHYHFHIPHRCLRFIFWWSFTPALPSLLRHLRIEYMPPLLNFLIHTYTLLHFLLLRPEFYFPFIVSLIHTLVFEFSHDMMFVIIFSDDIFHFFESLGMPLHIRIS